MRLIQINRNPLDLTLGTPKMPARAETAARNPGSEALLLQREDQETRNRILLALPQKVREQMLRHCQRVEFPSGHMIYPAGAPVEHAYFIESGLVSLVKSMEDGQSVEVGAIGTEGIVGLFAVYGFDNALADYLVQVPVVAQRVKRTTLRDELSNHEVFHGLVEKYMFLLVYQIAQAAACNRLHSLEQRLSRWLLTAHDNAFADHFSFTHEFLAALLGVQRPSLSTAANRLQKRGLIRYMHGRVTILDRAAIEKAACECYRTIRQRIDALFDEAG